MELLVRVDTIAKLSPAQAESLSDRQKVQVKGGSRYPVESHYMEKGHVKVAMPGVKLGPEGRNTWYFFAGHVELSGNEPGNDPRDDDTPDALGPSILLPTGRRVELDKPIIVGGNFTWAEATKNGSRVPASREVVDGIVRIAETMQVVRGLLGDRPITINSWYRDPATNRRIGGASRSRHMQGDAVDFTVAGLPVSRAFATLEPWWGDRGGLAYKEGSFVHIDARGYKSRWRYP